MNELSLFSGAGGGLLATHHLLGWRCVGYVEKEEYPCRVLEARINDGLLSRAPVYQMHTRDFIRLGLAEKYQGLVDVITAGFPCQPFSRAGKRQGGDDERNGWPDCIAVIRIVRPRFVLLENSSTLTSNKYFGTILGDLAKSGYDCRWDCIPAEAVGANHQRDRVWIVAYANGAEWGAECPDERSLEGQDYGLRHEREEIAGGITVSSEAMAYTDRDGCHEDVNQQPEQTGRNREQTESVEMANTHGRRRQRAENEVCAGGNVAELCSEVPHTDRQRPQGSGFQGLTSYYDWWEVEPRLDRVVDGLAHRVDRIKAIGNGQVPAVVAEVWRMLH